MTLPANVLQLLNAHQIGFGVHAAPPPMTLPAIKPCHVRAQLLEDAHGRVQALVPAEGLLDLNLVNKQFGRDLTAVSRPSLQPWLKKQQLSSVPAVPHWQGLPTLVDAAILQQPSVLLASGDQNTWLALEQAEFQRLTAGAKVGTLAVKAPEIPVTAEGDIGQMTDAISLFTTRRIKQRLEDTLELPPLSETAQRIIQLRANPKADISDLAKIIELDPSLSAQVVSWAASPYYSAPGKIRSVQDAIVRVLGFDMVMNLALGLCLGRGFNTRVISQEQMGAYWHRAVAMAAVVEGLVTSMPRTERPSFGLAYLSGLLHNFGYLILAEVFPSYFTQLSQHYEVNPYIPAANIERHLLGVSSCQMAAWLAETWMLPSEVVVALRQQNNPSYTGAHSVYPNLVYLATQLLASRQVIAQEAQPVPAPLFKALSITPESVQMTIANILESGEDLLAISEKMQG